MDNSEAVASLEVLDIQNAIASFGWTPSDEQALRLKRFLEIVQKAPIAIVSRRDRDRLIPRHLLPSLAALPFFPAQGKVLDIGSGGGFPAIPLAIARQDLQFALVDSTRKKVDFLSHCIRLLGLTNATAVWSRSEVLSGDPKFIGSFEVVTARAVAKMPALLPIAKRFLPSDGKLILWKGRNWRREGDPVRFAFALERESPLSDGSILLLLSRMK
ncbi:MAG: 16S rRNA (guanine(527)-N(7))-methyltransferase RsmG [Calditrichaeota bacterium]|nr:16S rRNA (guanine(527)-N(7))-methyltransferase RsmG [Calditrichota bacterium]